MSFPTIMILFGTFLIVCGAITLLAGNLMWWVQRTNNSFEGLESERSGTWEFGRMLRGIMLIIGGLVFIFGSASVD